MSDGAQEVKDITINFEKGKKITLPLNTYSDGKLAIPKVVRLTNKELEEINEKNISAEDFMSQLQKVLGKKPKEFIFTLDINNVTLKPENFKFLLQLFDANLCSTHDDVIYFSEQIAEKYTEPEFLAVLADFQLESKDKQKSRIRQILNEATHTYKIIKRKDKITAKIDEIVKEVGKVVNEVEKTKQEIDSARGILDSEQSSEIQKLNAKVELFELMSQIKQKPTAENIVIKNLLQQAGIEEGTQLTDILDQEAEKELLAEIEKKETAKEVEEEIEGEDEDKKNDDKTIATQLLIKLYQDQGYLNEYNQITKEGLNEKNKNLASLYSVLQKTDSPLSLVNIFQNIEDKKTFENVIQLYEELNGKLKEEDVKKLQAYITKAADTGYKILGKNEEKTSDIMKILAKFQKRNKQLYDELMKGVKNHPFFKLAITELSKSESSEVNQKKGKSTRQNSDNNPIEEEQKIGADAYNQDQANIDIEGLGEQLDQKFLSNCKDEKEAKERLGIISRIIRFLLGIKDKSEQDSLVTYIRDAKDFDQLRDFDKNLNDIVGQTKQEVRSIFLDRYNHRKDRLKRYEELFKAEEVCLRLEDQINNEFDQKLRKTLERELKKALKNYRKVTNNHIYWFKNIEQQLKQIRKNHEKTNEHRTKHENALRLLNEAVDITATEVAGQRVKNNQLLNEFRSR